jgi:hypothetical protein
MSDLPRAARTLLAAWDANRAHVGDLLVSAAVLAAVEGIREAVNAEDDAPDLQHALSVTQASLNVRRQELQNAYRFLAALAEQQGGRLEVSLAALGRVGPKWTLTQSEDWARGVVVVTLEREP